MTDTFIFFAQGLQCFLQAKWHQHAQQVECCKNSRMRTTVSYQKNPAKNLWFYNHVNDEKTQIRTICKPSSQENLFADEHPPTKKTCPQHILRIHTSLCILCLLPASVTIPAGLKSSSPVLSLLSTNTLCSESHCSRTSDLRFKSSSIPNRIKGLPL